MTPKAGAKFLPQWHFLNMCQGGACVDVPQDYAEIMIIHRNKWAVFKVVMTSYFKFYDHRNIMYWASLIFDTHALIKTKKELICAVHKTHCKSSGNHVTVHSQLTPPPSPLPPLLPQLTTHLYLFEIIVLVQWHIFIVTSHCSFFVCVISCSISDLVWHSSFVKSSWLWQYSYRLISNGGYFHLFKS
jgi:hypothetical protein